MKNLFVILTIIFLFATFSQRAEATFDEVLYYEQIQARQDDIFDLSEIETPEGYKVLTEKTENGSIKRFFDTDYNKIRVIEYDNYGELYRITNIKYDSENRLKGLQGIIKGVIEYYNANHEKITKEEWEKL